MFSFIIYLKHFQFNVSFKYSKLHSLIGVSFSAYMYLMLRIKRRSTTQFHFIENKTMNLVLNALICCIKYAWCVCVNKNELYIARLNIVQWRRQINKKSFSFFCWKTHLFCLFEYATWNVIQSTRIHIQHKYKKELRKRLKTDSSLEWNHISANWSVFNGSQWRILIAPYNLFCTKKSCLVGSSEHCDKKKQ